MRILHFGDIHVWRLNWAPDFLYPKRLLGSVNLAVRRRKRFPQHYARAVIDEVVRMDADAVIFSGDFTTMSLASEFNEAVRLFQPLVEKWGDQFFCIPGNHDRYTPASVRSRLYENALPFGAFEEGKLVRRRMLGKDLAVVGFDCSHPCMVRSNGTFTESLDAELRKTLQGEIAEGNRVLLTGHYPFLYPDDVHPSWEHKLLQRERLAEIVREYQPVAFLHGHKHQRWLLWEGKTLCINCGAAGMKSKSPDKQAGFVTFDLDDSGVSRVYAHVLDDGMMEFKSNELEIPGE